QRRGCVLHRPNQVEIVVGRIQLVEIVKNLKQTERKHDCTIVALFLDHLRGEIVAAAGRSERDLPRIERPVLRPCLPGDQRADEYSECDSPYHLKPSWTVTTSAGIQSIRFRSGGRAAAGDRGRGVPFWRVQ